MYVFMESIEKREKKKSFFLICCKPVAMENPRRIDYSGDPVFKYIAAGNDKRNDNLMIPTILPSLSDEKLKVSDQEVVVDGRRRKKAKISRILKAVFFETSLARKLRNRKARKKADRFNSKLSTKDEKFTNSSSDEKAMPPESSDTVSSSLPPSSLAASSLSDSSCSSMRSLNSKSLPERKTTTFRSNSIELKQRNDSCNYGLCLLLISLLVLIFWGRICAIFCTSTWLFFVPRRSIPHASPENGPEFLPAIDTVEYRKRIIMEGLLERNRSRVLQ